MITFGNHKLGDDTAIFNMSTAIDCPSRKLGMCEVINKGIKCYAEKPERQYHHCVPAARARQQDVWRSTSAHELLTKWSAKINRRRKETHYLRFNEAGDFHDQQDVEKLSYIASGLKPLGITTYGYTARKDLDFRNAKFLVKGSGHDRGNNGRTIVLRKGEPVPDGYLVCPGNCRRCDLCRKDYPWNIAFRKH